MNMLAGSVMKITQETSADDNNILFHLFTTLNDDIGLHTYTHNDKPGGSQNSIVPV
jgi:hypothetical protein